MTTNWTGGQYSVFRILLGGYLFIHFVHLAFWGTELFSTAGMLPIADESPLIAAMPNPLRHLDSPFFVALILWSTAVCSLFLCVGQWDRVAAIYIWLVLVWVLGRNPLISNPSMPYVGWMLLMHVFVPTKPFGSLSHARHNGFNTIWRLPFGLYFAAWAVLALSYSYSGYTKMLSPAWLSGDTISYVLVNPLARDTWLRDWLITWPGEFFTLLTWTVLYVELLFLPMILFRKLQFVAWFLMLSIQCGFLVLLNFPDLTSGMLLIHLLTFDPGWLKPKPHKQTDTLFFDGSCALCHSVVRFLINEDTTQRYTFAPLGGDTFVQHNLSSTDGVDSIILRKSEGTLLMRSSAIIHLLRNIGGLWRILSWLFWAVPRPIRDFFYDIIGRYRIRIFGNANNVCPLLQPEFQSRFLS